MADYSIALQGKPMQITSQEDYLKEIYALQNAQQANQLNQMKMDEYARGVAKSERFNNALAQAKNEADIKNAFISVGDIKGYQDYLKGTAEQAKLGAETTNLGYTGKKTQGEIAKQRQEFDNQAKRDLSFNSSDDNVRAYAQDAVLKGYYTQEEADRAAAQLLAIPVEQRQAFLASQGASAGELKPHFVNQENIMVNGVPTTRVIQMPAFGGTAATVAGSTGATYNKPAASTVVNVDNKQESEFNKQLGGGQAKKVLEDKGKAEEAAQILATNQVAKNLLDKGMLTGVGAEFFTTLNQGLSQAGIDFGKANAAQNSQAFGALMAKNTAAIIKNFGAGTGISDADRIYAKQAAAGDITMDENAIREIIKVNDRVARAAIAKHNKNVSGIQTNVPLTVDVRDYTAGIPEGRTSTSAAKKGVKTLDDIFK